MRRAGPAGVVVTFLLLDVEGSTRRWELDPAAAAADMARLDAIVHLHAGRHGGRVVRERGEGDSHFIVFDDPVDAADCATELQHAFHDEAWAGGPLRVRGAVHVGEVEHRDGDYYGQVVNRCARLRAAAAGGQVLLSGDVAQVVSHRLPPRANLIDHGRHRLADLLQPEHIWELQLDDLPNPATPLQTMGADRHNMPIQTTSFRGRREDVDRVLEALWRHRLVTLTGPGGIGKTRLGLHVAAEALADLPDGVWLAELAGVATPELVPVVVAEAVGLRIPTGRSAREVLLESLPDRQALLVLDNCEHLLTACAELAADLLRAGGGVRMLATSRVRLATPGEHRFRVDPLPVTRTDAPSPAVQLFLDRAAAVRDDLDPSSADVVAAATRIAQAVEGMPLGLELAAGRAAHLSLTDLADRIDGQIGLLADGSRPDRHATLAAAIGWSVDQLDAAGRRLLAAMAVVPDTLPLAAVEALATACDPPVSDPIGALAALVDHSLVVADLFGGGSRYRLLQPIRAGVSDLLDPAATLAARRALLEWLRLTVARDRADVDLLAVEIDTARDLFDNADGLPLAALLQLAADLVEVWVQRLPTEGVVRLQRLLSRDGDQPTSARVAALNALGDLQQEHDVAAAARSYEAALTAAEAIDDGHGRRRALAGRAIALTNAFEHAKAIPMLESVILDAETAGDTEVLAEAAKHLGRTLAQRSELDRAEALLTRARDLRLELGHQGHAAVAVAGLAALVAMQRGDHAQAHDLLRDALAVLDEVGYRQDAVVAAVNLGRALVGLGRAEEARTQLEDARRRAVLLGPLTPQAWIAAQLGELARQQGDLDGADERYREALALFARVGNKANDLYLRANRAHVDLARGREAEAEAVGLSVLAEAASSEDPDAAVEFLELVAEARIALAAGAGDHEAMEAAAVVLGSAGRRREVLGMPREPVDEADHVAAVDRVVGLLGRAGAAGVMAVGAATPMDAVVRQVLGTDRTPEHL